MHRGYKLIILKHLKDLRENDSEGGWIKSGKIRGINTPYGFIGFRGDRDVRDLVSEGVLERRMNGKFAEVRYKVQPPKTQAEQEAESERLLQRSLGMI